MSNAVVRITLKIVSSLFFYKFVPVDARFRTPVCSVPIGFIYAYAMVMDNCGNESVIYYSAHDMVTYTRNNVLIQSKPIRNSVFKWYN